MSIEQTELRARAGVHGALSDPARLQIVDMLAEGDLSPTALARTLGIASNLLAHHLNVLQDKGLIRRVRSEGDGRRSYLQLVPGVLAALTRSPARAASRVLFVCTANSARSHLAAALWHRASAVPVASAGTHPAARIDPGALDAAKRHGLPLRRLRPRGIADVQQPGDLIVTVCDSAHEELGEASDVHWSVADPVRDGSAAAFDRAFNDIARRVGELAPRLGASRTGAQP